MPRKTKQDILKNNLLAALEKSLGVVTTACRSVGCGRDTFYRYMKDDEDFANQVKELQNVALDFAESKLHKLIDKGNPAATIFFLKTKGKNRGYVERQEVTGADGESIKFSINIEGKTPEIKE